MVLEPEPVIQMPGAWAWNLSFGSTALLETILRLRNSANEVWPGTNAIPNFFVPRKFFTKTS